jgi:hypothetical protein
VEHLRLPRIEHGGDAAARARAPTRHATDPVAEGAHARTAASRTPATAARAARLDELDRRRTAEQLPPAIAAMRTDGATPSSRNTVAALEHVQPAEMMSSRPADAPRRKRRRTTPIAAVIASAGRAAHQGRARRRCFGLRARQRLDRDVGHDAERAEGAREQLAEVVAGDVLDHPAARLERLAAPRHRGHAEEMVARGAGLDAARAGQIGGERAAERARRRLAQQDRAVVHRLEVELLAVSASSASISAIGVPARRTAPVPPARRA